jgi:hypothetical protein
MSRTTPLQLLNRIENLDQLEPSELSCLIQGLISCEVAPGGPYLLTRSAQDSTLNAKIYRLFSEQGKILEGAYSYALRSTPANTLIQTSTQKTIHKNSYFSQPWHTLYDGLAYSFKNNLAFDLIFKKVQASDVGGEISHLSAVFYESCKPEFTAARSITPQTLSLLAYGNQYAWLAYSLYDHLIDEAHASSLLPLATMLQRQSIASYASAGVPLRFCIDTFDSVDTASVFEISLRAALVIDPALNRITISQFPSMSRLKKLLTERSFLHVVGPLYIGKLLVGARSKKLRQALSYYCAARQLSDDIHDWVEDFSAGRLTYVGALLLKNAGITPGKYNLKTTLALLQQEFWDRSLVIVCDEVLKLTNQAIVLFENTLLQENSDFANQYIVPLQDAANAAIASHQYSQEFIKNF